MMLFKKLIPVRKMNFLKKCSQKECAVKYAQNLVEKMLLNHKTFSPSESLIGVSNIGIRSKIIDKGKDFLIHFYSTGHEGSNKLIHLKSFRRDSCSKLDQNDLFDILKVDLSDS